MLAHLFEIWIKSCVCVCACVRAKKPKKAELKSSNSSVNLPIFRKTNEKILSQRFSYTFDKQYFHLSLAICWVCCLKSGTRKLWSEVIYIRNFKIRVYHLKCFQMCVEKSFSIIPTLLPKALQSSHRPRAPFPQGSLGIGIRSLFV